MANIKDILKVLPPEIHDEVIILSDGKGWTNIAVDIEESKARGCIVIKADYDMPFDD